MSDFEDRTERLEDALSKAFAGSDYHAGFSIVTAVHLLNKLHRRIVHLEQRLERHCGDGDE